MFEFVNLHPIVYISLGIIAGTSIVTSRAAMKIYKLLVEIRDELKRRQ